MCLPCDILQVLHVSTHQHCPQLHKVAVPWVFHCIARLGVSQGHGEGRVTEGKEVPWSQAQCFTFHDAPGVETAPDSSPSGLYHSVAANYSKWDAFLEEVWGGGVCQHPLPPFSPVPFHLCLHLCSSLGNQGPLPPQTTHPYIEFYFFVLPRRNKMGKGCPGVATPLGLGPVI